MGARCYTHAAPGRHARTASYSLELAVHAAPNRKKEAPISGSGWVGGGLGAWREGGRERHAERLSRGGNF